ncbi:hypothetical protein EKD04_017425 [Chloroflexales bacterium ZM16-3]|nr:hypothetical protein [Chloroflexales bacterium ZM16-3]
MSSLPTVNVPRKLYVYREGRIDFLQSATVKVEQYREADAWEAAIGNDGFLGKQLTRAVAAETVGGLPGRIYRRANPGTTKNNKSLFKDYDFLIDVDMTYIIRV